MTTGTHAITTDTHAVPSEKIATLQEARSAIENLRNEDYTKLMLIARYFAVTRLNGTVVEPDDLLHEAILTLVIHGILVERAVLGASHA